MRLAINILSLIAASFGCWWAFTGQLEPMAGLNPQAWGFICGVAFVGSADRLLSALEKALSA